MSSYKLSPINTAYGLFIFIAIGSDQFLCYSLSQSLFSNSQYSISEGIKKDSVVCQQRTHRELFELKALPECLKAMKYRFGICGKEGSLDMDVAKDKCEEVAFHISPSSEKWKPLSWHREPFTAVVVVEEPQKNAQANQSPYHIPMSHRTYLLSSPH